MTREEELDWLCRLRSAIYVYMPKEWLIPMKNALDMAIKALDQESCDDTVSRGVFEQVMWERDTAIEQLRELGYDLGQKIEPCDDCVSRQAVLNEVRAIAEWHSGDAFNEDRVITHMKMLPPVLPKREQGEYDEDYKTLQIKLESAEVVIENLKEDLRQAREDLRYAEMR